MSLKCINATNGFRVYNDGTTMLCCMSKEKLTNKDGVISSITNTTLAELRQGPKAQEIINALEANEYHPNCERCWAEEAAGVKSKRIRDNEELSEIETTDLKVIELNLGTTCNLKCRICGPWSSSQWNKEYLQIDQWKGTPEDYKKWLHDLNHSYDDGSLFWDELKKHISTLEKIEMYGGEPFLVKKQWEILQYSIDNGYCKNQSLSFNTNGTFFEWEKVNIMREFKNVNLSFSIDGIGKRFEYQRHPAKWNDVLDNLKKYRYVANKYDWELSVCITVNNYNIFYLIETLEFFQDFNIGIYLNFLHDPSRYAVSNLHESIKSHLSKKYTEHRGSTLINFWLNKAVEYMNLKKCSPLEWNAFLHFTKKLDTIRGENFIDAFPELNEFIKNEKLE